MTIRPFCRWRSIATSAVALAGLGSIIATGGGDGRNLGGIYRPVNVLPVYAYEISSLSGATPFEATIDTPDGSAIIAVDLGDTLSGTVDTGRDLDDRVILPTRRIVAGSRLSIDSDLGVALLGTFELSVVTDLELTFNSPPDSGAIDVTAGSEVVRATFFETDLTLRLNSAVPLAFTWDGFRALLEDAAAPEWQRRASLAYFAMESVYRRAFHVFDALNDIIDGTLPSENPTQSACDPFTGTPPPGVIPQGMWTLTWLGSGSLQRGDDFRWEFTDCRVDDPSADRGELLSGGVDLLNYSEITNSRHDLTRIGFEPTQTTPGGVVFDGFLVRRLLEDSLGNFTAASAATLSGGFAVVFFAP